MRALRLCVLGSRSDAVERDGESIVELAGEAELESAAEGWTYAGSFVLVKLGHLAGDSEIVLQGTVPPSASSSSAASSGAGADSDAADDDGGCGCRTRGTGGASAALTMLALMAAVRRRSRGRARKRP